MLENADAQAETDGCWITFVDLTLGRQESQETLTNKAIDVVSGVKTMASHLHSIVKRSPVALKKCGSTPLNGAIPSHLCGLGEKKKRDHGDYWDGTSRSEDYLEAYDAFPIVPSLLGGP